VDRTVGECAAALQKLTEPLQRQLDSSHTLAKNRGTTWASGPQESLHHDPITTDNTGQRYAAIRLLPRPIPISKRYSPNSAACSKRPRLTYRAFDATRRTTRVAVGPQTSIRSTLTKNSSTAARWLSTSAPGSTASRPYLCAAKTPSAIRAGLRRDLPAKNQPNEGLLKSFTIRNGIRLNIDVLHLLIYFIHNHAVINRKSIIPWRAI